MKRLLLTLAALGTAACAANMGAPKEISLPAAAIRADPSATPAQVAAAIRSTRARVVLVAAPEDTAWFRQMADAAGMSLSGPALAGDLGLAFLGPEVTGDTAIDLAYDGGHYTVMDALYEIEKERYLDLLAFRVERPEQARPLIASLLEYVATDVMPSSAVILAVAVPNPAVGDSVEAMFSPGYYEAVRCPDADASSGSDGFRVFYGPEARIFCRGAAVTTTDAGTVTTARLVMGRR